MARKWKPNKAQREAFKQKMQDPAEQEAYLARKQKKEEKRRAGSQFDYGTAGGEFIPTLDQYTFCITYSGQLTDDERHAFDMVRMGYDSQEKVHHDYIHIVNELRRKQLNNSLNYNTTDTTNYNQQSEECLSQLREDIKQHIVAICTELAGDKSIIIYEVEEQEMSTSTRTPSFNIKGFTYFAKKKEVLVRVENSIDQRTDTWELDAVEIQDMLLLIQWYQNGLLISKPV